MSPNTCTNLSRLKATTHASEDVWQMNSTEAIFQGDVNNNNNWLNKKVPFPSLVHTCMCKTITKKNS